jgi:hypothetical protein
MDLLDFTYWNELNESQKVYYIFNIPNNTLPELNKLYQEVLIESLGGLQNLTKYQITDTDKGITVSFMPSEDSLVSCIYGDMVIFKIELSLFAIRNLTLALFTKAILVSYKYNTSFIKKEGFTEVNLAEAPGKSDEIIKRITTASMRSIRALPDSPEMPSISDYANVLDDRENETLISNLQKKLGDYLTYATCARLLEKHLSESPLNLEEISADINTKLAQIKSIDFTKISSKEKEDKLKDVLVFQKELLFKANTRRIESPTTTSALIDVFRILSKEIGGVKEISKALSNIKS